MGIFPKRPLPLDVASSLFRNAHSGGGPDQSSYLSWSLPLTVPHCMSGVLWGSREKEDPSTPWGGRRQRASFPAACLPTALVQVGKLRQGMSLHQTTNPGKLVGAGREVADCLPSLLRGAGGSVTLNSWGRCQMSGWSCVRVRREKDRNGPEGEARSSKWGTTRWTNVLQTFSEPLRGPHTVTGAGDSGGPPWGGSMEPGGLRLGSKWLPQIT